MLDPSVNLVFAKMQEEMKKLKKNLETTEEQLSGWKFTSNRLVVSITVAVQLNGLPDSMK